MILWQKIKSPFQILDLIIFYICTEYVKKAVISAHHRDHLVFFYFCFFKVRENECLVYIIPLCKIFVFFMCCPNPPNSVKYVKNLTLQKIAIWMSKYCQKLDIFINKNCQIIFFKIIIFGIFFTFKCQFYGGSGE